MKTSIPLMFRGLILMIALSAFTENSLPAQSRKDFFLPDIPGFFTLNGDFHMHTIFSDGSVWPADRVKEAWRDGLDVIAITDHVEYSPHKDDVVNDLNRPYDIAKPVADKFGIILIRAAEITRKMPPGHFNAYFLTDPNALRTDSVMDAFKAAADQGAFISWNHPGWKAQQPDTTRWFPQHTELYAKGWLQGIEVFNNKDYYPIVHRWALEKKLTQFANSDVHDPIDFDYLAGKGEKRPITIVFAKERSVEGVRDAFLNQRTVACFNDTLTGEAKNLEPLIRQTIRVMTDKITVSVNKTATVVITNISDLPLNMTAIPSSQYVLPKTLLLGAHSTIALNLTKISIPAAGAQSIRLNFLINNVLVDVNTPLKYGIDIKVL